MPTERKDDSAGLLIRFYETGEREEILDFLFSVCLSDYEREEDLSLSDIAAANEADRKAIDEYLRGRG